MWFPKFARSLLRMMTGSFPGSSISDVVLLVLTIVHLTAKTSGLYIFFSGMFWSVVSSGIFNELFYWIQLETNGFKLFELYCFEKRVNLLNSFSFFLFDNLCFSRTDDFCQFFDKQMLTFFWFYGFKIYVIP